MSEYSTKVGWDNNVRVQYKADIIIISLNVTCSYDIAEQISFVVK
jgi:long-subunit fatty acid transport protein